MREITKLNSSQNHSYIAGLDGLRALAISFIAAYHFSFGWASGGFLGVDIFFVLSGYLMTAKILQLQENQLDISLHKLWTGRIQRLLPAVYTVIAATVVWVILLNRELLKTLLRDAAASIFYMTNWWFVFHKLSYFDSFGIPSPLKHLWFLAVQEQFFFIWSFALIIGLKYFKKREMISVIVFIIALCSALLMGIMYNPDLDPSRIYYGTDTRSFELLIGSCLAIVLPMQKPLSKKMTTFKRNAIGITGIIALAVFIVSAILVDEFQSFLYRGEMLLLSFNIALLIACICQPNCLIGDILSLKPLRWIGTRSYGIYLWHYPIIVLTTPIYEIGNPAYWRVGVQLVIICIVAELTYRFIETPIRKLGLSEYYRRYLSFNIFKWRQLTLIKRISAVTAAFFVLVLFIDITAMIMSENKVEKAENYPTEIIVTGTRKSALNEAYMMTSSKKFTSHFNVKYEKIYIEEYKRSSDDNNETYNEILAIGDSIMLDIAKNLKEKYSNITINGKVSRQMSDAIKLAPTYKEFNDEDKAVIIELGTNGYITDKQIDSLLNYFSNAQVYLVNTRVPRSWEKKVNILLMDKAEERENVTLIDWYSTAIKHPEYFGHDGVHLKTSGSEALTNLISEALNAKHD